MGKTWVLLNDYIGLDIRKCELINYLDLVN